MISNGYVESHTDESPRSLRVVCIGAGISGIITAIRLPQRLKNVSLQIYEKNLDIGGTWYENKYPGCACDIPAHTYQLTFEPNKEWTQFYASAKEIHSYWKRVVEKYDCMRYIKLGQRVAEARWEASQSKWMLTIEDLDTGTTYNDSCNVLIAATGALNQWKWPEIPGLDTFRGNLMHSANWDEEFEYKNKDVAVIGSGSSAIQIVPALQPSVKRLDNYIRGQTWIATPFAAGYVNSRGSEANYTFTKDEIAEFKSDPKAYREFQKGIELELQSAHGITLRGSVEQEMARAAFTKHMRVKTTPKPSVMDILLPSFPPACRRLTPGPGYLESLCATNVDVISQPITQITTDGIVTNDGQHRKVDSIVCATGFDTSFTGGIPTVGEHGKLLSQKWEDVPATYLSLATDGFPNYFISLGPSSGLGTGNLLTMLERIGEYVIECIGKMQRDNIAVMAVKKSAVDNFVSHSDKYFEKTIFSQHCRSWYKNGKATGRVNALWPGSSLHAMQTLKHPRWEDFDFSYVDNDPMAWFGDGRTDDERNHCISVDYLDDENIDFPKPLTMRTTTPIVNGV